MLLTQRPRRNRKTAIIRDLIQESHLRHCDLILPLFVVEGCQKKIPISSLPGVNRYSMDYLGKEIDKALKEKIFSIALFPVIEDQKKDAQGTEALNPEGLMPQVIRHLKQSFPEICLIADVALDPYTTHGHDGILDDKGYVSNDESVEVLKQMSLVLAQAGADMVAPSDMMDGRILAIRQFLDQNGHQNVSIHAYSAKYASCLYAPFREALHTPKLGNKKSYQLNPANVREALREADLDEKEGADILMVKPAMFYLDVIAELKKTTKLPISAFQVSGEYSMIMAASEKGWLDGSAVLMESLIAIKRAGADMIFTYGALQAARLIE